MSQQLGDEVLGAGGEVPGPLDVDPGDSRVGLLVGLRLEGRLTGQEFEAEHSQSPQVDFLVVVVACKKKTISKTILSVV